MHSKVGTGIKLQLGYVHALEWNLGYSRIVLLGLIDRLAVCSNLKFLTRTGLITGAICRAIRMIWVWQPKIKNSMNIKDRQSFYTVPDYGHISKDMKIKLRAVRSCKYVKGKNNCRGIILNWQMVWGLRAGVWDFVKEQSWNFEPDLGINVFLRMAVVGVEDTVWLILCA